MQRYDPERDGRSARNFIIKALLETTDYYEAARLAGVTTATVRRWMNDEQFVKDVFLARQRQLVVHGATAGWRMLRELTEATDLPPAVKLQTAKLLLSLGGHTEAGAAIAATAATSAALVDLSQDQLEAHIDAGKALLERLKGGEDQQQIENKPAAVTPAHHAVRDEPDASELM